MPDGYLSNGYFDEKGNIHPSLITSDAYEIAERLENSQPRMSRSQLRNFYNEVADIRHLIRTGNVSFDAVRPRVLKLAAFAHNATSQRSSRAPELFRKFIEANVPLAGKDQHHFFDGFYQHFECVVLYFKGN